MENADSGFDADLLSVLLLGRCIAQNLINILKYGRCVLVQDIYLTEYISQEKAFLFLFPSLNQVLQSGVFNAVVQFEGHINLPDNTEYCYNKQDTYRILIAQTPFSCRKTKPQLVLVWCWWLALIGSWVNTAQQ